jgi:predicted ABC-type transport system involved in lysophospholipase L1 biosynthesis ATPase subunit
VNKVSPVKLEVRDLRVSFSGHPVASVPELNVDGGEIVGLAGESGSGKSMTILAVLGLAETAGAAVTGSVRLDGQELIGLSGARLRAIRGRRIAAIFQSPALAFNPVFRVGAIVSRTLRPHGLSAAEAAARADAAMRSVLLSPDLRRYPAQLSGGRLQQVAIALALALRARCCWPTADQRPGRDRTDEVLGTPRAARRPAWPSCQPTWPSSPSCATGWRSCAPGRWSRGPTGRVIAAPRRLHRELLAAS